MSEDTNDWTEIEFRISGGKEWMKVFQFSKYLNSTKCLLCNKRYSGCFKHNLKRHICNDHKPQAALYGVSIKHNSQNQEVNSMSKKQKNGNLSPGEYIKNCVLLAAINMTAFLLFNSPFFRALTLVHAVNADFIVNSASIGYFIDLTASAIRNMIASEIRNRLISVKIDIATRHHRSMLCVNVQFYCVHRRRITIRTLGCIELKRAHTSSYLEQEIYRIFSLYEIDRKNIYSYTSDNGANLICLGKLIQKMQQSLLLTQQWEQLKQQRLVEHEELDEDLEPNDDDLDFEFEYQQDKHAEVHSQTIDDLLNSLATDTDDSEDESSRLTLLLVFCCAAHTLQLAVHDVLSKITQTSITHIRNVVKDLKSSKYLNFNTSGIKSLKLNVCSRWNSLYKMFESILKHQESLIKLYSRVPVKDLDVIKLTPDDFKYMTKFNEAFKPVYELTLALQSEQLAMSDVLIHWYCCKRDLSKLEKENNEFIEPLTEAFDRRTEQIMKNPLLATACFVDPRLNYNKTSIEFLGDLKEVAEKRLLYVVKRIKEAKINCDKVTENHKDSLASDEDDLEQYIALETSKKAIKACERTIDDKQLLEKIKRLGAQDKISIKSDVLGYYENLKKKCAIDNDLFEAVMVILAAPATQVSVERAFSALALVLDKKRCNLKSSTIDDVLIIGLNRNLTSFVDFESMRPPRS